MGVGDQSEQITFLTHLAHKAIERLRQLPQPAVRVCGPFTSGGFGYDENLRRFKVAEKLLKEKGYTVFEYFGEKSDEVQIREAGIPWELVMEHYHAPILKADLLQKAFFMPRWQESNGAKWEHEFLNNHTSAKIEELPEEWS